MIFTGGVYITEITPGAGDGGGDSAGMMSNEKEELEEEDMMEEDRESRSRGRLGSLITLGDLRNNLNNPVPTAIGIPIMILSLT